MNNIKHQKRTRTSRRTLTNNEKKRYYLDGSYGTIYFTEREMDVAVLLLENRKYFSIAEELKLSERTIEFYVKQMKLKLRCEKQCELTQLLEKIEVIRIYHNREKTKETS